MLHPVFHGSRGWCQVLEAIPKTLESCILILCLRTGLWGGEDSSSSCCDCGGYFLFFLLVGVSYCCYHCQSHVEGIHLHPYFHHCMHHVLHYPHDCHFFVVEDDFSPLDVIQKACRLGWLFAGYVEFESLSDGELSLDFFPHFLIRFLVVEG
ncbi:hypothetical protein TSUD_395070 [Trifolium subterraneum]|uniref:Uncharacterized protein n=1 Tax=Trifolium subterraneum TaxID=3900 RepID=A0A2Z6NZA0_TRISU|nr:hypothetical protein TSUD_395070 [Trifolium subterraneum]